MRAINVYHNHFRTFFSQKILIFYGRFIWLICQLICEVIKYEILPFFFSFAFEIFSSSNYVIRFLILLRWGAAEHNKISKHIWTRMIYWIPKQKIRRVALPTIDKLHIRVCNHVIKIQRSNRRNRFHLCVVRSSIKNLLWELYCFT